MSWWGWVLIGFAAWVVVGCAVAPLVGRWLRRVGADYPAPDDAGSPLDHEPPSDHRSEVICADYPGPSGPYRRVQPLNQRPDRPHRPSPMS